MVCSFTSTIKKLNDFFFKFRCRFIILNAQIIIRYIRFYHNMLNKVNQIKHKCSTLKLDMTSSDPLSKRTKNPFNPIIDRTPLSRGRQMIRIRVFCHVMNTFKAGRM